MQTLGPRWRWSQVPDAAGGYGWDVVKLGRAKAWFTLDRLRDGHWHINLVVRSSQSFVPDEFLTLFPAITRRADVAEATLTHDSSDVYPWFTMGHVCQPMGACLWTDGEWVEVTPADEAYFDVWGRELRFVAADTLTRVGVSAPEVWMSTRADSVEATERGWLLRCGWPASGWPGPRRPRASAAEPTPSG